MTDHKLTDDEIIHSLKVCSNDGDCSECKINPHKGNYGYCTSLAIKAALDLINHQKAEIEKLNDLYVAGLESLRLASEANKDMQAELKSLKHRYDLAVTEREANVKGFAETLKTIKSEAIKEFAKKIKTDAERICDDNYIEGALIKYVDTLVKEMTETK